MDSSLSLFRRANVHDHRMGPEQILAEDIVLHAVRDILFEQLMKCLGDESLNMHVGRFGAHGLQCRGASVVEVDQLPRLIPGHGQELRLN